MAAYLQRQPDRNRQRLPPAQPSPHLTMLTDAAGSTGPLAADETPRGHVGVVNHLEPNLVHAEGNNRRQ
ncbi:hypothetical protein GCM10009744_58980 [Kribbella alba]|uniref:Transposase n=1 Tax=Kribbella alba TaxID=190197 RepID=A0ABN2FS49_9ACTN